MEIFDTLALLYICVSGVYIIYKIYVSSRDGWDRKAGYSIVRVILLSALLYLTIL
jgi:hypothetical protein